MSDVYRSANLVIAAGSSKFSDDSFLETGNRPRGVVIPFSHLGHSGKVYCAPFPASGIHEDYRGIYGGYDPLFWRAWTLQECILTIRLIVFSSTELQWVCRKHMICEAGHRDSTQHYYSMYSITEAADAFHYWHDQVMEYTRRRMTLSKDKLPALAGVAREISQIAGGTYIGGLWEQNLIYDLCWERYLWEVELYIAMDRYHAPTFSWASVGGNVFYNNDAIAGGPKVSYPIHYDNGTTSIGRTTYFSKILEAHCTPLSKSNPFGAVNDGFIRIKGPLIDALVYDHPDAGPGFRHTHIAHFNRTLEKFEFHADVPLGQYPISDESENSGFSQVDTALRAPPAGGTPIRGAKVWLLNIGYFPHRYNNRVDCPYVWLGLLILGKSLRKPGAFERVGYRHLMWPPLNSTWPHTELEDLLPFTNGEESSEIMLV